VKNIVAFIDAPDPDNFVLLVALARLNPEADLHVVLTGRPLRFNARRDAANWDYDRQSSIMAQEASALRIKNFLRHFDLRIARVYDGGIAPRTLVPHWLHFADYYKFLDVDPLAAIRHSELDPQEDLIKAMLAMDECVVAVGGPMTGLYQVLVRNPAVVEKIKEVHAMFATWGTVQLMQFGDQPRGALQFNVACDPVAANYVLNGLGCPIYLMPTEVTRVADIGFQNAVALREALPQNNGTRQLYQLYALWYDAAVKPRQDKNPNELIFIHDFVSALSLDPKLREAIYDVVPVQIDSVPYLPSDAKDWGKLLMHQVESDTAPNPGPRFAAKGLKPDGAALYLKTLAGIFA